LKSSVFLLGVDPGLANMGWSVVELAAWGEKLIEAGVLRTEPSDKKRKVLASDDNVRRGRNMAEALISVMKRHSISAICAESMSFPRSSSASAKMALCWGSLVTLSVLQNLPIIQASPQEIKKTLCGKNNASKDDVEEAVKKRYGDIDQMLLSVAPSCREHAYDSIGATVTALENSEVIRAIRGLVA
jgi:crossover junction endodeoxyribonuclease RuvC